MQQLQQQLAVAHQRAVPKHTPVCRCVCGTGAPRTSAAGQLGSSKLPSWQRPGAAIGTTTSASRSQLSSGSSSSAGQPLTAAIGAGASAARSRTASGVGAAADDSRRAGASSTPGGIGKGAAQQPGAEKGSRHANRERNDDGKRKNARGKKKRRQGGK